MGQKKKEYQLILGQIQKTTIGRGRQTYCGREFVKCVSAKRHGGRAYKEYLKLSENKITDNCQQETKDLKRSARREAMWTAMNSHITTDGP